MKFVEEMVTVAELSEMMFNAKEEQKYSYLLDGFNYFDVTRMIYNAKRGDIDCLE